MGHETETAKVGLWWRLLEDIRNPNVPSPTFLVPGLGFHPQSIPLAEGWGSIPHSLRMKEFFSQRVRVPCSIPWMKVFPQLPRLSLQSSRGQPPLLNRKSAHKKMHRNKFQLGAKMQNMHVHFPPTLLSLSHVNLEMPSSV